MELTWVNKLRIVAVAALGIVVIGTFAWPLAAPEDPLLPVRASRIGLLGTVVLLGLAFGVGFIAYFIAWPHGRDIGILAVPFGLAVWAGRSGPMRALTQTCREPHAREALLQSLRFEPFYWLLVVAAGFVGVLVAQRVPSAAPQPATPLEKRSYRNVNTYINGLIALGVAMLVALFFIGAFAQNLSTSYMAMAAQSAPGQIVFAVIAAFAISAFIVKKFLGGSYIWPAMASALVLTLGEAVYYGEKVVQQFAESRPAPFFPHGIFAILPVQLVALGALGAVLGYWASIRYDYWRKHESGA